MRARETLGGTQILEPAPAWPSDLLKGVKLSVDAMAISPEPTDGAGNEALLLDTVGTVLQMAKIARMNETNEEVKVFYSHLSLHCFRLQEHLTRARQASSRLNGELVSQALRHLGSLVPESGLHELPTYPVTPDFRLKRLYLHWDEARRRHDRTELDFIYRWLKPGFSEAQRHEVDKALETCADELDKQQPEQPPLKSVHKYASTEMNEPPYAVCKAAKSIYDALINCKGCSCPDPHDFKAKLELGTYRSPVKKQAVKPARRRARRGRGEDDASGGIELDMFLSMERDWHEFRVQTVKERAERAVRFGPSVDEAPCRGGKIVEQYAKVERLCRPIIKTKTKALQRLVLRLTSGELFEIGFEKSNFQIDHNAEPISLSQCFEDRQDFFTEKTKRILSLIIGYTVLHLHGTSWLQPGWGSSNIKFFQTTSCKTPLRPFIEAQLPKVGLESLEDDLEDEDDELDSGHCCPEVVTLAVVLMEVYFAKPFKRLAAMHDIQLIETKSGRITLMDVDQVFEGDEENEEGWRSQIPEDSPLLEAIDNCLDAELWEDEEGQPLDSATLRSLIYQKVVRPLELDLTNGFRNIQLDEVDQYARNLDFGKWGQPMSTQESDGRTGLLSPREVLPIRSPSPGPFALLSPGQFAIGPDGWKYMHHASRLHSFASISTPDTDSISSSPFDYKALQFFDDQVGDGEHSAVETDKYIRWKSEYEQVYKRFVGNYLQNPPSQPVKIAVLDTGIDRDHFVFEAREENLKGKKNCYNESQKNVPDTHGHGTFTANLILDYAQDASLYVIKIADKENTRPDARIVANAINHAIDKWGVDIISMSFGWPSSDFDGYDALEAAIDKAISKKVLMFAAAANSGGRLGRAYPASSSQVICVHSTNTNGSASDFSPTAEPNAINIATVGESVQSAWPMLLCQNNNANYMMSRSGTSYATPIVAGMAAFLLQYARLHLSEGEALALKRREKMEALLRRCAVRGPSYQPRDGYFFVHLSLDKHNLFGGELDWVSYEISRALKT
ncbi:Peptidase-S8 domain-containing protein [Fusarium sp. LHS14.1]|nr:Peptidase-S8 domain-containing protein [Fusarium sp. LHS14.1]